ncbi:MAG: histidine phosphotransferase family protein [Elusimicrobiales bacterium]|nr:histidine phosphotransferase family protein [Elusimicrobiales bacterium]
MTADIRLAQLLCSRLCHDLVGPAGAVNAGLELAEDGDMDGAALDLVTSSASEVTRRLAFFRIAFGAAGGKASAVGTLSLNEARELAAEMLAGGKADLHWPESSHAPDSLPAGVGKVLLLMILLASECLPRGGTVTVHTAALPEGAGLAVSAQGGGAALKPNLAAALAPNAPDDALDARTVHAYFAQNLARADGGFIDTSREADGEIRFMALFPQNQHARKEEEA